MSDPLGPSFEEKSIAELEEMLDEQVDREEDARRNIRRINERIDELRHKRQ